MRHFNVELPKYRLQLHVKLIKRRKPLLEKPIIPTASEVKRKYRTGSFPGRLARYFADHKNIRKILASAFVFVMISAALIPQPTGAQAQGDDNIVIEPQTNLLTEKSMVYPVTNVKVNQGYSFFHRATDFGGTLGTSIKPIMNGIVAYAGWDRSGYGNLIVLNHGNGFESYYAHLSKIEVTTGQSVDTKTEIGQMGATGRATGVHLHLEILQNGISLNPLTVLSN